MEGIVDLGQSNILKSKGVIAANGDSSWKIERCTIRACAVYLVGVDLPLSDSSTFRYGPLLSDGAVYVRIVMLAIFEFMQIKKNWRNCMCDEG